MTLHQSLVFVLVTMSATVPQHGTGLLKVISGFEVEVAREKLGNTMGPGVQGSSVLSAHGAGYEPPVKLTAST